MRRTISILLLACFSSASAPAISSIGSEARRSESSPPRPSPTPETATPLHLPWREAGWTSDQAAAHLLGRFSFGARPGEVEAVAKMGLERWLEIQLEASRPDVALAAQLAERRLLGLSPRELNREFPPASRQGGAPQRALLAAMMDQKLLRALESENQLTEVMVDFWFNHFNVSFTDPQVRPFLVSYERDAIRPNALGHFVDLLAATAHHPAMLAYLDNARSSAAQEAWTTLDERVKGLRLRRPARRDRPQQEGRPAPRERGLNENYARELMELHTLGVDGGYTQKDVTEVARAFSGWTVMPIGDRLKVAESRLARVERAGGLGFERVGDFLFRADEHDAEAKLVLGVRLPAGRGVEDGEQVLELLAAQEATARHLAEKLAVRFVADQPPARLVDRLTATYLRTQGDVCELLRTIAESPEFWSPQARGAKIKSPFELAVSALRVTGSRLSRTMGVVHWIAQMGEPLYLNQLPTGYPDRGSAWVNTGTLVSRMNFALDLAAGRIQGVEVGVRREGLSTLLASPDFQRR